MKLHRVTQFATGASSNLKDQNHANPFYGTSFSQSHNQIDKFLEKLNEVFAKFEDFFFLVWMSGQDTAKSMLARTGHSPAQCALSCGERRRRRAKAQPEISEKIWRGPFRRL